MNEKDKKQQGVDNTQSVAQFTTSATIENENGTVETVGVEEVEPEEESADIELGSVPAPEPVKQSPSGAEYDDLDDDHKIELNLSVSENVVIDFSKATDIKKGRWNGNSWYTVQVGVYKIPLKGLTDLGIEITNKKETLAKIKLAGTWRLYQHIKGDYTDKNKPQQPVYRWVKVG